MRRYLLLLPLLALAAGCDSNDNDGLSASVQAELEQSNEKIASAVEAGLATTVLPACPEGGTVTTTDSGDLIRMTFDDCNDVTGTLDVGVALTTSALSISEDGNLSVQNSCDVGYDNFRVSSPFTPNPDGTVTATLNGRITADCPSGNATCTFSNVTIRQDPEDTTPLNLEAYCN